MFQADAGKQRKTSTALGENRGIQSVTDTQRLPNSLTLYKRKASLDWFELDYAWANILSRRCEKFEGELVFQSQDGLLR